MQLSSAAGVISRVRRVVFETHHAIQFIDVTDAVTEFVRGVGVREGVANVFLRHTTAAVCIQEDEPLLLEDLRYFLQRSAPAGAHYRHNDFRVRTVHMHEDESPNGHSHCQQIMLGSRESIPVENGELLLGAWQRIFLIELDGPRAGREVIVQAFGTAD